MGGQNMIKKILNIMIICSLPIASSTQADMTGAGDAAILAQLVEQFTVLKEQYDKVVETVDIQKRIEEMEQLKAIKRISDEGQALGELYNISDDFRYSWERDKNNPFGLRALESDLQRIQKMAKDAENGRDYAAFTARLKRLKVFGQANEKSSKKISGGSNESDDIKTTAINVTLMTDILIDNENSKTVRQAHEMKAIKDLMGNNSYSNIYNEQR